MTNEIRYLVFETDEVPFEKDYVNDRVLITPKYVEALSKFSALKEIVVNCRQKHSDLVDVNRLNDYCDQIELRS